MCLGCKKDAMTRKLQWLSFGRESHFSCSNSGGGLRGQMMVRYERFPMMWTRIAANGVAWQKVGR